MSPKNGSKYVRCVGDFGSKIAAEGSGAWYTGFLKGHVFALCGADENMKPFWETQMRGIE